MADVRQPPEPTTGRSGAQTLRTILTAIGLFAVTGVFAVTLLTREHAEPVVPVSPVKVAGDVLRIPANHPAWQYVLFDAAQLAPALVALPVPGRVIVDEGRTTRLMAPLLGRVDAVAARLGEHVQKGDKLLSVRSGALVDLVTEEKLAETGVSAQSRNLARVKSLVDLQAAPVKDLQQAERDLKDAQLALDAAVLKGKSLRVEPGGDGLYWLVAPRAGVVVERDVAVGEEVGPNRNAPLLVIAELDEVLAIGSVPEADLGTLAPGEAAAVTLPSAPGRAYPGTIEWVSQMVDAERHTVDVRVRLKNEDGGLRPNAWVQVAFQPVTTPRIVLPSEAVVTDEQRSVVFVRAADQSVQRRTVQVGRQRSGRVEVMGGVQAGEKVAVSGALLLLNALALSR